MHPKVEDALRRAALKRLFTRPALQRTRSRSRPYSGDWTVGEPIPEEMLATLNQAQNLLFSDKKRKTEKTETAAAPQERTDSNPKPNEPGKQDA